MFTMFTVAMGFAAWVREGKSGRLVIPIMEQVKSY